MSERGIRAGTVLMNEAEGPEEVPRHIKSSMWTVAQVARLGAIVIE